MRGQASQPCNSRQLAKKCHLPEVDSHIVVRHPKHARALFGHQASIILHDIRNAVVPSWCETSSTFVRRLKHVLHTLPIRTQSAGDMYFACLPHLESAWHIAMVTMVHTPGSHF